MIRRVLTTLALMALASWSAGCSTTRHDTRDAYGDEQYSGEYPTRVAAFHDDLAPYGRWVERNPYGWVWSPYGVAADWRPYTDGRWAYSDLGWTWVSYDPWGSDPCHYGRWFYDDFEGWCWVPDDDWGPAWVAWRYGDGYCGWAALPPDASWGGFGLVFSVSSVPVSNWCFVPERYLWTPRVRSYLVPVSRNERLVLATRNVTRYSRVNGVPAERGLSPTLIERDTGKNVPRYRFAERASGLHRERIRGNTLEVPRAAIMKGRRPRGGMERERAAAQVRERTDRAAEARVRTEERRAEQRRNEARIRNAEARAARDQAVSRQDARNRREEQQRIQEQRGRQERQRIERGRAEERARGVDEARANQARRSQEARNAQMRRAQQDGQVESQRAEQRRQRQVEYQNARRDQAQRQQAEQNRGTEEQQPQQGKTARRQSPPPSDDNSSRGSGHGRGGRGRDRSD